HVRSRGGTGGLASGAGLAPLRPRRSASGGLQDFGFLPLRVAPRRRVLTARFTPPAPSPPPSAGRYDYLFKGRRPPRARSEVQNRLRSLAGVEVNLHAAEEKNVPAPAGLNP
ncbi:MAG: hypothetical protein BJ554DRAFT_5985, partial [Olpidium bornovanus]